MIKILVPTDFSPTAKRAAEMAVEIAAKMNEAEITILHCIETSDLGKSLVHEVEDILMKEAGAELNQLKDELIIKASPTTRLQTACVFEKPTKSIVERTSNGNTDLIVMGTKGAGGLEKFFWGSNASSIVNDVTECPVLVVPENAQLKPVQKITYASDLKDIKEEEGTGVEVI